MLDHVQVLLVGTTHPGNVGAAARALKTMGLSRLALVAACAVDDHARANAGAATDVLDAATVTADVDTALAGAGRVFGVSARPRRHGVPALSPRDAAAEIAGAPDTPVAVMFGREHSGLTNEEIGRCHRLVHIPANPDYASLNLAAAVQVVCYELRLAAAGAALPTAGVDDAPASANHLAGLYDHLARVMAASGYAAAADQKHLMQRLRRLFNRAVPEHTEVNILRGILAAVERRLPPPDGRE
ncbi:RNA methyltransferase [Arhodomonas aquaeolei]|uniref:RNA methyltransferase n=1 Tax=Arhodomonas aquaeolei TaxID=2369 RepID=UPI00038125A0|nr:RNA methyltransferase [Arhodomonas aquaeolei]